MRTTQWNGKILGNSLNVYNFYKKATGRGLQADLVSLSKLSAISAKVSSKGLGTLSSSDIAIIQEVDSPAILSGLYAALRKAGDEGIRNISDATIVDELTTDDLEDPNFITTLIELISTKKG